MNRPVPEDMFCRCGRFADEVACHDCGDSICDQCRFRCEENGCWPHDYCDRCAPLVEDAHLCKAHRLSYLDRQDAGRIEEIEFPALTNLLIGRNGAEKNPLVGCTSPLPGGRA
jgi:hypothetical protein